MILAQIFDILAIVSLFLILRRCLIIDQPLEDWYIVPYVILAIWSYVYVFSPLVVNMGIGDLTFKK